MRRIVVMLLELHAGILQRLDDRRNPQLRGLLDNQLGKLSDRERFSKLVEDPIFTGLRRIQYRQLDTPESVANVKKTALLTAATVYAQRDPGYRLYAKPIESRAEHLVVMETGLEALIELCFVGFDAVDDTLMEVRSGKVPYLTSEPHIVAVVHF